MPAQSELRFTFTIGTQSDDDADDAATADTDAGIDILADAFDVIEFRLTEGLSQTFLLDVQLSCANPAVDFAQVLDQNACLTLWQGGLPVRFVHGAITSFVQGDTGHRRTRYSVIVEPRLARLQLASDWRIFQTLTVAEIAQAVLKQHAISLNYEQRITNAHLPREYCVQAGDTDYHFVERILR